MYNYCCPGDECETRGCPGTGESCSGNGLCTISDQTCTCDSYWTGEGCDTWDCPGDPIDCNGLGKHIVTFFIVNLFMFNDV